MTFHKTARQVPLTSIKVTGAFWSHRLRTVANVTIPTMYDRLVETDRLRNFERAALGETGGFSGYRFNDSDVYKWAEACAYSMLAYPTTDNRARFDNVVELIAKAQRPDGYLNTYIQIEKPGMEWRSLSMMHEMYCGGHLIEAACAAKECLGDDRLLTVAIKWVDHVMSLFGPGKKVGFCGHQELELAFLKLADTVGEPRYREYARWQVEQRGMRPSIFEAELEDQEAYDLCPLGMKLLVDGSAYSGEYLQDHQPIRDHESVVGHAVRAMYLYIAATQLAEGDEALSAAMLKCWASLVDKRMYITGGIGPSGHNEGFTTDYDLPNHSAYAETCAAIGLALWGQRLFEQTGDSAFVDVLERALYNGALSGISLSGDHYFYANPLESRADHARSSWFGCACCPPNIARLIGQVGSLAIAEGDDGIWINLPIGIEAETSFGTISVESNYPWSGSFSVKLLKLKRSKFKVRVRIPEWCDDCSVECEGAEEEADFEQGYAILDRDWYAGDIVKVECEMNAKWYQAHPSVLDNLGRAALCRGPLVYCAESTSGIPPQAFSADLEGEPEVQWRDELEGVMELEVAGWSAYAENPILYMEAPAIAHHERRMKLIPYFAWGNRGPSHMQVWLRH